MADADFVQYESEDDTALNDVYDNLGSEEIESSDGLPTEPEEVNNGIFFLFEHEVKEDFDEPKCLSTSFRVA